MDVRFGVFDHVAETEAAGVNYLCVDLAFGDITLAEALRTVELLAAEVMPHFGR